MTKLRFLVCGCNGMAGHIISLYLKEQGHYVFGFDKNKSTLIDSVVGDACNKDFVKDLIIKGNYDAVINCIGILNKAADENKELAVYLNSYFPHFLADITKDLKTQIVHLSTDCVFSGKKGNYIESSFQDGTSFYARTKALGELNDNKNLTLRGSIVGPDINKNGIGLLNWFLHQKGTINGFTKVKWTGQTTLQLAKTIEYMVLNKVTGLINSVPNTYITKYNLCQLFNKYLRKDKLVIKKYDRIKDNKSLKRTNFNCSYKIPNYEVMVIELADWINQHKSVYNSYEE